MDLKVLRAVGNGVPVKKALQLGIDYRSLIASGLARKIVKKESKFLVPANSPRWALKYKFTRKKHGIEETVTESEVIILTEKAKTLLKKRRKDDSDDEEKVQLPLVEKTIIDEEDDQPED